MSNRNTWENQKEYGDLFYKRAIGELPEMECSKAVAKIIKGLIQENDIILDVGCGAGHYLTSLLKEVDVPFRYEGIDQTEYYIIKAREAFPEHPFTVGDINNLRVPDQYAEIVMCHNVLLHLPSIELPIKELLRVSKKYILIRTLIGSHSFRIKQVEQPELYENGEPIHFHYHNIYSEAYLAELLKGYRYALTIDNNFDPMKLGGPENYVGKRPDNLTVSVAGYQINEYIIQPWRFILIEK